MTQTTKEFWDAACRALPDETAGRSYRTRSFGTDEAISKVILGLILAGQKTGTFAVDWEYDARQEPRPARGDLYIVIDHAGAPRALVRITATERVAFSDIGERHVQCEGPALRSIEPWRKLHWDYWSRTLRKIGREPAEDMPVLYQAFELLYPRA